MMLRIIQVVLLCPALLLGLAGPGFAEQASRIRIVNDRWPDASSLERFAADAVRILDARTEEEKALALFRFIRMFTTRTDGNVPREPALGDTYLDDPLKILNVYGAHHCDGLTRIMELAWRSMGGRAEKLYRSGHTQANVFWTDPDGVGRWHLLDMSEGWFVFDRSGQYIAGPDEIALDYSLVYRPSKGPVPRRRHYWGMWNWIHAPHLPWPVHDTTLSLRAGEKYTLYWDNIGLPYQDNFAARGRKDLEHGPYPVTYGNGVRVYTPDLSDLNLPDKAVNLAVTRLDSGQPKLHPSAAGLDAEAVFRISSPHVIADAWLDGVFQKGHPADELFVAVSTDNGATWRVVWQAGRTGTIHLEKHPLAEKFDIYQPLPKGLITPFGRYDYLLKVRMRSAQDPESAGVQDLAITTVTQHNIFALPMLWPGTNTITLDGDLPESLGLRVTFIWDDLNGREQRHSVHLERPPFTYRLPTAGRRWEDVRAKSLVLETVARDGGGNLILAAPEPGCTVREIGPAQAFAVSDIVGSTPPPPLKTVSEYIADLADPDKQVEALSGLMVIRDKSALPAITQVALQSIDHPQKDMAIQALHLIGPEESRPVLLEILGNSPHVHWKHNPQNKFVQLGHWYNISALIAHQMADVGEQAAVPLLMTVLESVLENNDKSWEPHASILRSLGRLGDPTAAPIIRSFLDGHLNVVAAAARALGKLDDKASIPRLRDLFRSSDYPMITLYAGEALIMLGDREVIPDMHVLLQSANENLRALAVSGLQALGGPEDLAVLEAFLAHERFSWVKDGWMSTACPHTPTLK